MSEERSRGQYVRKVQQDTRRYTMDLLTENERLRGLLAQRDAEHQGLEERIGREKDRIQEQLLTLQQDLRVHEMERLRLQRNLARVEEENRRHAEQQSLVEQQNSDLANLYVASYRLHGALDREELIAALIEIIANVVGCEETLIFELDPGEKALRLAGASGVDPEPFRNVSLGMGIIGTCASSGEIFVTDGARPGLDRPEEATLSACIPLKLKGQVSGVIALFRLLPQKVAGYEGLDREVFDLLGAQAATALYCSALHGEKSHRAA